MNANAKAPSRWKQFRYRLEVAGVGFIAWLIPKFPRRPVVALGRALGWLAYHLSPKQRRYALTNLDIAFHETKTRAEKARIARASFQNFGGTMLGLFWSPRLNREVVDRLVDCNPKHIERVHEIQARGKGIVFLTFHYGDWELLGLATGFYGVPLTVVMDNMRNVALENVLKRLRGQSGHRIITEHNAAPALLKTLKRGGNIALLIDLNAPVTRGGVWLKFFGMPVFNNSAAAALSLHTGATIVCAVATPLPGGRAHIVYGAEIEFTPTGHYEDDVRALSQKCLDFCENLVRERPEYWLWSYKRWKHAPTTDLAGFPFYAYYTKT